MPGFLTIDQKLEDLKSGLLSFGKHLRTRSDDPSSPTTTSHGTQTDNAPPR